MFYKKLETEKIKLASKDSGTMPSEFSVENYF